MSTSCSITPAYYIDDGSGDIHRGKCKCQSKIGGKEKVWGEIGIFGLKANIHVLLVTSFPLREEVKGLVVLKWWECS